MLKITKFGGSSCASAEQFRKVKAIIEADPSRRFVVISAAGRKTPKDNKLTDLLYLCRAHIEYHVDCQPVFDLIKGRLLEIKTELGLNTPIEEELSRFREALPDLTIDDIASRGEYFTSRLMADFLGFPFVDAKDVVAMEFDGTFNFEKTTENLKGVLQKNSRFACVFGLSYLSALGENISVRTVKNLRCSARIRTKAKEFCAKAPF